MSGGTKPLPRSGWRRVVERRTFEKTGGIVGVRPCGRGQDKGDKGSADKHRSLLRAFLDPFPPVAHRGL